MVKTEQEWRDEVNALRAENMELHKALQEKKTSVNLVNVRWFDGYLETFEALEIRFGNSYLWMRLIDGQNRHIPLNQVRWFSLSKESHAVKGEAS